MTVVALDSDASFEQSPFDWPLFGLQDDLRPALAKAKTQKAPAVLATLYGVEGAAPREVGAQMLFTKDSVVGFLSGGCIEADLAIHAQSALASGQPARVTYGEGGPMDIRLPCGSRIDVLLEALSSDDAAVARLLQYERDRHPVLWLTNGEQRACVTPAELKDLPPQLNAVASLAASSDQICGSAPTPFAMYRAFAPRRRLLAIGADPIALAVVKLAAEMGLETTLIRPRGPETCPLPSVRYDRGDVEAAISAASPDPWTAIAILTHAVEQEHAALVAALPTHAGYIGVLGSRRRTAERAARLAAAGFCDADIKRIHAPIGLPIGSKAPWEIAISVIAEIVRDLDTVASSEKTI